MLFRNKFYKYFMYIAGVILLVFFTYIYFKYSFRISARPLLSHIKSSVNIIPFKTIGYYVYTIINPEAYTVNTSIAVTNLLKMTVVGTAAGFILPQIFKKLSHFGWLILCESIALVVLEAVQLIIKAGSFDIDDLILLIIGTAIGYAVLTILKRILAKVGKQTETATANCG